ncbi:hypothetical protein [Cytobacillus purgationiresistens]|uniref:DNA-binding transcriptional MocR family regulator n=1 Tax=Cytobacillus purgationiresistens TaxID=863449 RepID=A0ABU0ALK1_9BACI|nr:hypothetical protein [Cytobacillus purgationiresistens]MDQ0271905.1 DNA-binding transcriptional MocR family regulator [Cytobacillus purgationiresistens]
MAIKQDIAGFHIQVTVKTCVDEKVLLKLAKNKGVRIYDFNQMWMRRKNEGFPHFYLGFAGMIEADMEMGICSLKEVWESVLI